MNGMAYIAERTRYEKMTYTRSGRSGLRLPQVSLGLWHNFGTNGDFETMKKLCFTAFDAGVTHFDLANNYGPVPGSAEENFGKILKEELSAYRDELIVSTKAGYEMWEGPYGKGGSRKYLLASLDQSLHRMGLDYVDIFYHHCMDKETPVEESMMALDAAVKQGKALYAGISNYDLEHTMEAMEILDGLHCPFVINQVRYSIFDRWIERDGLKKFAKKAGCGLIAFSPLAQGLLSDRYLERIPEDSRIRMDGRFLKESALTEERLAQIRGLREIAHDRGQTLAQMALAWVLRDGDVTSVLIGASKPEQIAENVQIAGHTDFTEEELGKIDALSAQQR